jgi:hypothetical protein
MCEYVRVRTIQKGTSRGVPVAFYFAIGQRLAAADDVQAALDRNAGKWARRNERRIERIGGEARLNPGAPGFDRLVNRGFLCGTGESDCGEGNGLWRWRRFQSVAVLKINERRPCAKNDYD